MAGPAPSTPKGERGGTLRHENLAMAGSPADRENAGALEPEIPVGSPHLSDPELPEPHQARCVDIRELVSAQALELAEDFRVMLRVDRQQLESRELGQGETERSSRLFAQAMEEPAVGLGDHGERGQPPSGRIGEETDGGGMIAVGAVEERDADAGVEEDRPGAHGRARPYTISSTVRLASGSPDDSAPAYRIQG